MRTLRWLHRYLGLLLAIPLLLQGLSGAILTIEPALPSRGGAAPAAPLGALFAAARDAAPPGTRVARLTLPDGGDPAIAAFAPLAGGRGSLALRLDPATAAPLGPPAPETGVIPFLRQLHTNWLLPQWGGRQLAGWCGVGLLALAVLGIPLWWPRTRWRDGWTVPRGAKGLRLQRRLHGAAGAWLWLMLIVTASTGIVEAFPQTVRGLLGLTGNAQRGRTAEGAAPSPDLDAAAALARQAQPGLAIRAVFLPAGPREPIRFIVAAPGSEGVLAAGTVLIDAAATRIVASTQPGAGTPGELALRWAHDLHFGQGFGPLWRLLTIAVGLVLPLLGITGALHYLLRRRNRRRLDQRRRIALEPDRPDWDRAGPDTLAARRDA